MKDIPWFEWLYAITEDGRVWSYPKWTSNPRGKFLRHWIRNNGYIYYSLALNKEIKKLLAHRLVAMTYIPSVYGKNFVNHRNWIRTDNRVENLEWCTHSENVLHGWHVNLRKASQKQRDNSRKNWAKQSKVVLQYTSDDIFIQEFVSATSVHRVLWFSQWNISACARWEMEFSNGFKWKYKNG